MILGLQNDLGSMNIHPMVIADPCVKPSKADSERVFDTESTMDGKTLKRDMSFE